MLPKLIEKILNEFELEVSDGAKDGGQMKVTINGKNYSYDPVGIDIDELVRKFNKIKGFSKGRSLAWLKKNTKLVGKEEPVAVESFDSEYDKAIESYLKGEVK